MGKGGMLEHRVADAVDLLGGTEAEIVLLPLGRGIHPCALASVEGHFLFVVGHPVLPQLGADALEEIAQVSNHGEIVQDGVFALRHIVNEQQHRADAQPTECREPGVCDEPGHGILRTPWYREP